MNKNDLRCEVLNLNCPVKLDKIPNKKVFGNTYLLDWLVLQEINLWFSRIGHA